MRNEVRVAERAKQAAVIELQANGILSRRGGKSTTEGFDRNAPGLKSNAQDPLRISGKYSRSVPGVPPVTVSVPFCVSEAISTPLLPDNLR